MWGLLVKPVVDIFGGWIKHKQEIKEVTRKSEVKIQESKTAATIKRIEAGDANAARLDEISLRTRGYKDDYLLFMITVPVIMVFIPVLRPFALAGFEALGILPEWYMWILLGVYIDTFGFRRMLRVAMERWVERKFS